MERQDARQVLGQHRLVGARRADHQLVMTTLTTLRWVEQPIHRTLIQERDDSSLQNLLTFRVHMEATASLLKWQNRRQRRKLFPSWLPVVPVVLVAWFVFDGRGRELLPGACTIKGNISVNTGERIYHVPGGEYYSPTKINIAIGERWFCTEAEAQAAGWRGSRQ